MIAAMAKNKAVVAAVTTTALLSAYMLVIAGTPAKSIPWWKSLSWQLLYSPRDVELMEKLERISLAADLCKEASNKYAKEKASGQISSASKKQLLEASVDIDYLFSVLDKTEFSSGIIDLKMKRKELVNKCNAIAKEVDQLVSHLKSSESD